MICKLKNKIRNFFSDEKKLTARAVGPSEDIPSHILRPWCERKTSTAAGRALSSRHLLNGLRPTFILASSEKTKPRNCSYS